MKYCQKHNQEYYDNLDNCPICIGENPEFINRALYQNIQSRNIIKTPEQKPKFKRKLSGFKL